jgi:ribosomal protein S6
MQTIKITIKIIEGNQFCYLTLDFENKKYTISKDKEGLYTNFIFQDTQNNTTNLLKAMIKAEEVAFSEFAKIDREKQKKVKKYLDV